MSNNQTFVKRCEAVGLYEGSLFTWLEKVEQLTAEIEALKQQVEQGKRDAMPEWLPIETAPKDGTEILLRSKNGRIANGVWMTANDRVGAWLWPYIKVEPAHWMPLPAAPKQEK